MLAIEKKIRAPHEQQPGIYSPDANSQNWNMDHYGPIQVPANDNASYFVLGDNRHNALDSRFIGFVQQSQVLAVVE